MIHNTKYSLCLEDSAAIGEVLLQKCNLDSEFQQWIWINHNMLMCAASSRCLSAMQREPLQTQSCEGPKVDTAGLMWDCDKDRLISRNTSMLLSIDGRRPILTHDSKHSKWRSLDEGDICQKELSKSAVIKRTQRLFYALSKKFVYKINLTSIISVIQRFIKGSVFTFCWLSYSL